ncbi:MAG TPA: MFS transporter [Marmoricola sp.]|nr:MFS transporter [Marmoricola sp.]
MPRTRASTLYDRLVRADGDVAIEELGADARAHVAGNGLRQIGAQALQGAADQVVNAKTVLPWLLSTVGAPGVMLALLVPIRESGSMLPQAALTPWLRGLPKRKWAWAVGAAGQSLAAAAMALVAATASGWAAGLGILLAVAVLALARALCSLASKDVLGRTIPKGQRGQVNGTVTVAAGLVALTIGVALQLSGDDVEVGLLVILLAGAAFCWLAGLAVYAGVREPATEPAAPEPAAPEPAVTDVGTGQPSGWVADSWALLRGDPTFRRFVGVRALLLVSALSPPFVVSIGVANGDAGLSGLGLFVLAQGFANLLSGRLFGRLADRSSRTLMVWCAAAASSVIVVFLLLLLVPGVQHSEWLYPATYFLLAVVHLGTRVARKTYVVDVAVGDRRTEYVAVSNTAMGLLLLLAGVVTGVLAHWGSALALVLLAVLGFAGAVLGRMLPEVSAGTR